MKKMIKNSGFSLVEVMVAIGMLAGLGLVVMNLTKQSSKATVKTQFDTDVTLTTNEINAILSDPAKCKTVFGTTATPSNINGKYFISSDPSAPAKGYGNAGLSIVSYELATNANDGILTISYRNKNILKGTSGASTVSKKINLYVEGTSGAITTCRSLSTSSTDIWSKGTGADIFYSGGNVGIGTNSPGQQLEVNGGLALKTATVKPACDSTIRGTFWVTQAASGVQDSVEACVKDALDAYSWVTLGATHSNCVLTKRTIDHPTHCNADEVPTQGYDDTNTTDAHNCLKLTCL